MKFRAILISLLFAILAANAFAGENGTRGGGNDDVGEQKVERSVAVNAAVAVSLCVASGNITIHGWERNEVRARSADAVKIELAHAPSTPGASITKLEVAVFNKDEAEKPAGKCQAFSDIELNVPRGATVLVQTRDGDISIAEVAAAYAGTQNGDIEVQKISRSIEVGSLGGNISLKDSSGRVHVSSAGGSLEAANLQPVQADDEFEVITTSGDIMLSHVTHKQINTKTVSGNLTMTGPLAPAGRYGFNSFSGDVTLAMPANSSFKLVARVSQDGEIITEFPLTLTHTSASSAAEANAVATAEAADPVAKSGSVSPVTKVGPVVRVDVKPKIHVKVKPEIKVAFSMRRVNGVHGTGDAMISVSSFLGTLRLEQN
jgi:predicted DNA-binding protein with PD1-like motif